VFFNRPPRTTERQAIMDELVDLHPDERLVRLEAAVAEGRLSGEEREQVVRIFDRLENLRIMMVPSVMKWPEEQLIGAMPPWAVSDVEVKLPATYDATELIGIPIETGGRSSKNEAAVVGARQLARKTAGRKPVRAARRRSKLRLSGRPVASRQPVRPH